MHPLLLPLALLFLGATRKAQAPAQAGPKPTPPPGGPIDARAKLKKLVVAKLKQKAAAAGKRIDNTPPLRGDPYPPPHVTVDHPNVLPSEAERQAAVDAAVSHAIARTQRSQRRQSTPRRKMQRRSSCCF